MEPPRRRSLPAAAIGLAILAACARGGVTEKRPLAPVLQWPLAWIDGGRPAVLRAGEIRRLPDVRDASEIAVTRDGLAYVIRAGPPAGVWSLLPAGAELVAREEDFGGEGPLLSHLRVSGDGRFVGVLRRRGSEGGQLWLLDVTSRRPLAWTEHPAVAGFGFHPSSESVLAWEASDTPGPREVIVVDISSGARRAVTSGALTVGAAWDGPAVVVFSHRSATAPGVSLHDAGIWTIPIGGGEPVFLFGSPQSELSSIHVSASGAILARETRPGAASSLLEVTRTGRGRRIVEAIDQSTEPAWSPDGSVAAYVRDGDVIVRSDSALYEVTSSGTVVAVAFPSS